MSDTSRQQYGICHLSISQLKDASRIFKELGTAEHLFPAERLLAIGRDQGGGPLTGKLQDKYPFERISLATAWLPKKLPFQIIKYIEWTLRAAFRARSSGAKILHCHSLPPLLAGVIVSFFSNAKVVYDAHELESARAIFSPLKRKLTSLYERFLLLFVNDIIVVSPSIEHVYKSLFPNKNVTLLMNIPGAQRGNGQNIRDEFGIPDSSLLVMYVGGLVAERGIEPLLDAFSAIDERYHLVFMGDGILKSKVAERTVQPNIHLKAPVPERDIVPTISHADLTFSVNDCESLNHQYSLPNKFFQSLIAGVPVMVNKQNVDMLAVGSETGMVFGVEFDAAAIRDFITGFAARNVPRTPQKFSWEEQETQLIEIYMRQTPPA